MSEEAIEPPPSLDSSVDASAIAGLGHQGDLFVMLLDVDSIFADGEAPRGRPLGNKAA